MDILAHRTNDLSSVGMRLRSLLGDHAGTEALKTGRVSSPLVAFDFADVKAVFPEFKPMMRELKYDFGEIALNTYLQGFEYGKPYVLLPVTTLGRSQHHTIFYNAQQGTLTPGALNGKRVGVRAYTQTTGVWVRGFLAEDYGVDLKSVTWVTFEDPHLAEYREPPNVVRAPAGKQLKQMLLDGEIDAAILGDVAAEPPLAHLIPDHAAEAQRWARIHGGVPINHMAAIRRSIAESRPDVVREVYRLLVESRATASLPKGLDDPLRVGVRATRDSVERMIEYSFQQQLISRRPAVDEVYGEAVRVLGPAAD